MRRTDQILALKIVKVDNFQFNSKFHFKSFRYLNQYIGTYSFNKIFNS